MQKKSKGKMQNKSKGKNAEQVKREECRTSHPRIERPRSEVLPDKPSAMACPAVASRSLSLQTLNHSQSGTLALAKADAAGLLVTGGCG